MTDFSQKQKVEVTIIGFGLTGLIMTYALLKSNISIAVIEQKSIDYFIDNEKNPQLNNRTIAINHQSIQILKDLFLWEYLEKHAEPIEKIEIYHNYDPILIDFYPDHTQEKMGYIIDQYLLYKIIYSQLKEEAKKHQYPLFIYDNVQYHIDDLQTQTKCLHLNHNQNHQTSQILTDLIIAADGKYSKIRKLLNIKTTHRTYNQTALTFNIHHENHHNGLAIEHFFPGGPLATLPRKQENTSSVILTNTPNIINSYKKNVDLLSDKLNQYIQDIFGQIEIINTPQSYNLELLFAHSYEEYNSIIIGDAAHSIHPIAGQGFNLTIRDIHKLHTLLSKYKTLGIKLIYAPIHHDYQLLRKIDNQLMIYATHSLNKIFAFNNKIVQHSINIGMELINNHPKMKQSLISFAKGKFIN